MAVPMLTAAQLTELVANERARGIYDRYVKKFDSSGELYDMVRDTQFEEFAIYFRNPEIRTNSAIKQSVKLAAEKCDKKHIVLRETPEGLILINTDKVKEATENAE